MTSIIVTLVGAFTSPMVIFIIPGYLFYDFASKNETSKTHKWLSLAMTIMGVVLLLLMTTISFYVLRIDSFPDKEWSPKIPHKNGNNAEL
jgi:amino acid permease